MLGTQDVRLNGIDIVCSFTEIVSDRYLELKEIDSSSSENPFIRLTISLCLFHFHVLCCFIESTLFHKTKELGKRNIVEERRVYGTEKSKSGSTIQQQ